jgi:phosphatidylethanolamine-binding protein (PEBP) family uncharacterized protein
MPSPAVPAIWHWVIVDIPASADAIEQGAGTNDGAVLPAGRKRIRIDYGQTGWDGPCPPKGKPAHRYNFTPYTLGVTPYTLGVDKLDLPADATVSHVGFLIILRSIGKATLSTTYGR